MPTSYYREHEIVVLKSGFSFQRRQKVHRPLTTVPWKQKREQALMIFSPACMTLSVVTSRKQIGLGR